MVLLQKQYKLSVSVLFIAFSTVLLSLSPVNAVETPTRTVIATLSEVSGEQFPSSQQGASVVIQQTSAMSDVVISINNASVLKLSAGNTPIPVLDRAKIIQTRLNTFLQKQGNPRDIQPGIENNQIVIRAGQAVLVTVDEETAKQNKVSSRELALQWTNQIRQALGADAIKRGQDKIASRGFSPTLDILRANLQSTGKVFRGMASWYGPGFHGRRSANGERFDMNNLTAAHRFLPFNTLVKVTNAWTGQSAIVRITDRGPFRHNRVMDLSKGAAKAVGMLSSGTAPVVVEVLKR